MSRMMIFSINTRKHRLSQSSMEFVEANSAKRETNVLLRQFSCNFRLRFPEFYQEPDLIMMDQFLGCLCFIEGPDKKETSLSTQTVVNNLSNKLFYDFFSGQLWSKWEQCRSLSFFLAFIKNKQHAKSTGFKKRHSNTGWLNKNTTHSIPST